MFDRRQILGAVFVCSLLLPTLPVVLAQSPDDVDQVFLPAPRELQQRIRRAEKAIEEGEYGEAVMFLGSVLDGTGGDEDDAEDYFINFQGSTKTSLKARAERLLGSMPKTARDLYEVQYGADAKRLLDQSLATGELDSLAEVSRRYFHTTAGYESTMLLGRHYLRRGRPVAAAICFRRIAASEPAAARFEPEASFLLATSCAAAGRDDAAREVLEQLRERVRDAEFEINGQRIDSFRQGQDVLAWHEQVLGKLRITAAASADQWTLHRGNASRNATTNGSMPLLSLRWKVDMWRDDKTDKSLITDKAGRFVKQNIAAIPSLHPLVVDDWVLFRDTERLFGIDLKTGKRIWDWPWWKSMEQTRAAADSSAANTTGRSHQVEQRIWNDAPYGQLSSDGRFVFFLDELGYMAQSRVGRRRVVVRNNVLMPNPYHPKTYNTLVALAIEGEGKLQWQIGGAHSEEEPKLAGAFFLGAPLPIADELYAIAEMNGETKLVVLDANNKGRLKWSQQLTHLEQNTILADGTRRMAGASPSFADGVLVCPTSAGAVVGIDVATRSLMWGYAYKRANQLQYSQGRRVFVPGRTTSSYGSPGMGQRWVDGTVTIGEGCVVLTPVESSEIHCLDVLTGQKKWNAPRKDWLYVAAIHDDGVILVGNRSVGKFALADGQLRWRLELPDRSMPSGRGFVNGNHFYLATTRPDIVQIDLTQGKITRNLETSQPLGNLVSYRDHIISLSASSLTAFYQSDRLGEIVANRLKQDSNDAWALEHQGRLLLDDGKRDEALAALRRSIAAYGPDNPRRGGARLLLADTLLNVLRESDDFNAKVVTELKGLLEAPEKHVEFQRLMAAAYHRSGQFGEAFDSYLKLADEYVSSDRLAALDRTSDLEQIDKHRRIRRDRWLRHTIPTLIQEVDDDDQRRKMIGEVDVRMQRVIAESDPATLRRFVAVFGSCPGTESATLRLAERYINDDDHARAEVVLHGLFATPAEPQALSALAVMYSTAGRRQAAAECYRRLEADFADVEIREGQTGKQLAEKHRWKPVSWPKGKVEVSEAGRAGMSRYPNVRMPLMAKRGIGSPGMSYWTGRSSQSRRVIIAQDGLGQKLWQTQFSAAGTQGYRFANYHAMGHIAICSIGHDVVAIDTLRPAKETNRILWEKRVREPDNNQAINSTARPNDWGITVFRQYDGEGYRIGTVACLSPAGVCLHMQDQLTCLEPTTGDVLWSRTDVPADADIWGDDQFVFVRKRNSPSAAVYRLVDGENVGTKKVPGDTFWITTVDRKILTWTNETDGTFATWRLRLFDPWLQEDVWSRNFAPLSKADVMLETGEMTVVTSSGQIVVLKIADGTEQLAGKVDLDRRPLTAIHSFSHEDNVLVICRRAPRALNGVVYRPVTRLMNSSMTADADIYALRRDTGGLAWEKAVSIQQYELPLRQPPDLPIWFFGRMRTTSRSSKGEATVLGIDKRNGRQVFQEKMMPTRENMLLSADAAEKVVKAQLPNDKVYHLKLTDQALPPPSQDDSADSEIKSISDFVEDFFGGNKERKRKVPLADDPFGE